MKDYKEKIYNWQRAWKECKICDNAFCSDYKNPSDNQNSTLEALREEPCLILLGDAALGKSVCLRQENQALEQLKIPHLFINLKNISGEQWINEKFDEINQIIKNCDRAYFLIDSFDEGLFINNNLVNILIDKLKKLQLQKIYLRITCRTVVFPQYLYDELSKLFKVKIYKLQPLNREDIDIVLCEKRIDKEIFYRKVPLKEELSTPITAKYVIDEYPNVLELSKYEIYEKVCLKLSKEHNAATNKISLSPFERTNIASIIATLMTFTNKYAISYKPEEEDFVNTEALYLQKYLSEFKNIINILKLSLPKGNLEEVLNTGLFTGENGNVYFVQKTYQEFLTAHFIFQNDLYGNFKNLFFDEYNKVLPFFSNTIGWLAERDDKIFDEVLEKDPEILITGIVHFSDITKNKKLLSKFFEIYEKGFDGKFSHYEFISKINISKDELVEIIKPYLFSDNSYLICQAMNFLEYKDIDEFEERILEIAITETYTSYCRLGAIYLLNNFNSVDKFKMLSLHIRKFLVDDVEERSQYSYVLLNSLLPNHISYEDVEFMLSHEYDDHFYIHLNEDILCKNKEIHQLFLTKLIQPYLQESPVHRYACDGLLDKLSEKLSFDDDPDFFCDFLYKSIEFPYLNSVEVILRKKLAELNAKEKHKIFGYYFLNDFHKKDEDLHVGYYRFFFDKKDTLFLLKLYFEINDRKTKHLIKGIFLCCSVFSPLYFLYHKSKDFWENIFIDIFSALKNGELTYKEYRLESLIDKIVEPLKKIAEQCEEGYCFLLRKHPIDRINKTTGNFEKNPNVKDWANILYALSFIRKEKKFYLNVVPIDIEEMQGYSKLSIGQRKILIEIATFYLKNHKVEEHKKKERLTTNTLHLFEDLLLVPAMFLLYKKDRLSLDNIIKNNGLIEKSPTFLIDYPYYGKSETSRRYRTELVEYFLDKDSHAFIQELGLMLDVILAGSENTYFQLLNDLKGLGNAALNNMLLEKCKKIIGNKVNDSRIALFLHIIHYLVSAEDKSTKEFLESNIQNSGLNSVIRSTCAYYLSFYPNNSLEIYKNILESDREFGINYFEKISKNSYMNNWGDINNEKSPIFDEIELAQLYIILENYYPSSEDKYPNGVVTTRHKIASFRKNILNKSIDEGYLAFFEYVKTNSAIKIEEFNISRAKRQKTQKEYVFLSVENLLELILCKQKRIIFDSKHLFEVVLETLDIIAKEIRNNTAYLRLWNEVGATIFPKEETAFSDEISRELKCRLPNIIINREVEIQPLIGKKDSQRIDLLVQAIARNGLNASVVIEVKGCWNRGLRDSIKSQLCEDYLCDDNGYKHGIYLIGWFCCNKWDEDDKKSRMGRISKANRFDESDVSEIQEFFKEKDIELSIQGKNIKTVILDGSVAD